MNYPDLADLRLLSPMLIVSIGAMALLMIEVFQTSKASRSYMAWISVLFLSVAGLDSLYLLEKGSNHLVMNGMVAVDSFSLVFNLIFVIAGSLACLVSPSYLASHKLARGEHYALMLFSVVGMMTMAAASDLFVSFIGLEMMSIPIYCLAGFFRHSSRSAESSMKYFILGAFASAFFLYGLAFLYGLTGTTNLEGLARVLGNNAGFFVEGGVHNVTGQTVMELGVLPGLALLMILVAFAFKIAAVPFHMWTPDVYTGAPSNVTGFMASAVKAAGFAALIRVFSVAFFEDSIRISGTGWIMILFWLAMASMVIGNVIALTQKNIKRMLAYSSIAHAGYILVGFLAASYSGEHFLNMEAVLFYLLSYTFATIGAFAVLAYFGKRGEEAVTYDDLAGISKKYPAAALAMTIFMLSSAGIPPTAGFVAKFFVFKAAVQTGEQMFVLLAIVGILFSVAGVFYYLKVVVSMYMKEPSREVASLGGLEIKTGLVICALATLFLGLFPSFGLDIARAGVANMRGLPNAVQSAIEKDIEKQAPKAPKVVQR